MRAARVDENQAEIIEALRQCGVFVQPLHTVGKGVPDAMWSISGRMGLLEFKDGRKSPSHRRLTPDQQRWFAAWQGPPIAVVENVEQAIRAVFPK